ncbi:hypothetical protein BN1221_03988 [Brenneria goodwinii]|uniref:Uncharacterized protein n=1 Tax=Brenneria goodwinii TaxID=1109412 RepID=A0A0G4K025_9GAMM|nr:hypothetical protein BN1221_03988 [Brenneria goodwinii]
MRRFRILMLITIVNVNIGFMRSPSYLLLKIGLLRGDRHEYNKSSEIGYMPNIRFAGFRLSAVCLESRYMRL